MTQLVVTESGKLVKKDDIELVEKIMDLREKKDPWLVIDELVKVWEERYGKEEIKAYKLQVRDMRETLSDPKFGQTKDGQHFERRLLLYFPIRLELLIRTQYKASELQMDEQFFVDFVKRFPKFLIPEKI